MLSINFLLNKAPMLSVKFREGLRFFREGLRFFREGLKFFREGLRFYLEV